MLCYGGKAGHRLSIYLLQSTWPTNSPVQEYPEDFLMSILRYTQIIYVCKNTIKWLAE